MTLEAKYIAGIDCSEWCDQNNPDHVWQHDARDVGRVHRVQVGVVRCDGLTATAQIVADEWLQADGTTRLYQPEIFFLGADVNGALTSSQAQQVGQLLCAAADKLLLIESRLTAARR